MDRYKYNVLIYYYYYIHVYIQFETLGVVVSPISEDS